MDAAVPTSSIQTAEKAAEAVMSGLFISVFVAGILYGMTTLQTFLYWQAYPRDGTFLKSIGVVVSLQVAFIWVLETLHTALCIRFLYAYLILGFGDIFNFLRVDCRRMRARGVFAIARTGFAIGSTALCYIYPNWLKLRDYGPALATVSGGLGSAALVDLLVALTLTFYLKRGTNLWEGSYYHKQSTNMVNQILLYTVNTGAITSATSVVCVILFAANKVTLTFLGFAAIQTKLYANSFLGSLNARAHLRKTLLDNSGMFSSGSRGVHLSIPGQRDGPVVEVTRETIVYGARSDSETEGDVAMTKLKGGDNLA
ncbi:hypothetical protein L227DRAFT_567057 [Lentinus tigrinus ALCF2SS1-6]|uniref:DUF6534 domain-containing protein n=1 Tax=Lentinus tigrinus ALCF2SS1-6 TaxID=1328759 RepID=A0A5C2RWN3_9APHY|nr:hypothetical protein L227DRAFT_567057 [Lentinus tigrinus ALCF2SS1-6]